MDETQKQYEIIFILSPKLEGADLDKVKNEINEAINKLNGTISFKESEKRTLAYPINKQGQGIFVITEVAISPENINNLSKELRLNKQILRHLINQLELTKSETVKATKKLMPIKKKLITEKRIPSHAKASGSALEEIDKKLDELIDKI